MSTYAFVVNANNERYRAEAANLILSSKVFGDYTWYLVADKPLGIGHEPSGLKPRRFMTKHDLLADDGRKKMAALGKTLC